MTDEMAGDQPSDPRLFSPDGKPWCSFTSGSLHCINDPCPNPNHRSAVDDLE